VPPIPGGPSLALPDAGLGASTGILIATLAHAGLCKPVRMSGMKSFSVPVKRNAAIGVSGFFAFRSPMTKERKQGGSARCA